jgi:alpha-glucosidase
VVNTGSGKCLDVTGGGGTGGTPLEIWTCNGGPNQKWFRFNTTSVYKGQQSGRCIDLPGGSQATPASSGACVPTARSSTSTPASAST